MRPDHPPPAPRPAASLPLESAAWTDRDPSTGPIVLLATLAALAALYFARPILFPITLALLLTLLMRPLIRVLQRGRIPPLASAALVALGLLLLVGFAVYQVLEPAAVWIQEFPRHLLEAREKLEQIVRPLTGLTIASQQVEEMADGEGYAELPVPVRIRESPLSAIVSTGGFMASAFITLVLLFFLLALGDRLLEKIVDLMQTRRDRDDLRELVREVEQGISRYLLTVTTINTGLGIAVGTVMGLWGLPNPILWGAMAALLNFIPYLGAFVGITVVGFVALLTFDSPLWIVAVPLTYLCLTALEGSVVTPMILGRSMSLNPVMIVLSLTLWGWMWGAAGALLAVPLLAVSRIVCAHFPRLHRVGDLLGQ